MRQGQTLSATLDQELNQDAVVTYQTKPSAAIYIGENNQLTDLSKGVKVTNTAQLWKPGRLGKTIEVHGEAVVKGESWMTKTGVDYDLINKTMTWKLVIHSPSRCPLRQITV